MLSNFALLLLLLFARLLSKMFLGKLTVTERERVEDNMKFAIPETCLALTIFREELSTRVVALFAFVLVSKFFHWAVSVYRELQRCPTFDCAPHT